MATYNLAIIQRGVLLVYRPFTSPCITSLFNSVTKKNKKFLLYLFNSIFSKFSCMLECESSNPKWTTASRMWLLLVQESFLDMNLIFLLKPFTCSQMMLKHMEFNYPSNHLSAFCEFPDMFWWPVTDFWALNTLRLTFFSFYYFSFIRHKSCLEWCSPHKQYAPLSHLITFLLISFLKIF